MRPIASLICAVSVVALVMGALSPVLAGDKVHDVIATVVSADAKTKTLTFKDGNGDSQTGKVIDGSAVDVLKSLKEGDRVQLTCQDDDNGKHEGITAIKPLKA